MAHSPIVGTGISITTALASGMSTTFAIKTPYLRITARTEGAHVAFSQTATSVTADEGSYYIPAGTSATLSMSRYSQKIIGITTTVNDSVVLTCPEGMTMPFNVGNIVKLDCSQESSNGDLVNQYNFVGLVTGIDNSASTYDGTFQTKLTVSQNPFSTPGSLVGIATPFVNNRAGRLDTVLYSAGRIAARSDGGAGGLNIIQVQTTGEA